MSGNATDEEDRKRIISLHEEGYSLSRIAALTGFSIKTVRRWVRRYKWEGNLKQRQKVQYTWAMTEEEDGSAVTLAQSAPSITADQIVEELGLGVSSRTMHHRLHECGPPEDIASDARVLTTCLRQERLQYAQEFAGKDVEFWDTVVFSDENTFSSVGQVARSFPESEQSVRGPDTSVTVWGWLSSNGPGHLHLIKGRLTPSQYVSVMEEAMLPSVWERFPYSDKITLVHDHSPIHQSSPVREWVSKHPEIELLPWPRRAADLNPMGNLWEEMMRRWEVVEEDPSLIFHQVLRRWEEMKQQPEMCRTFVRSMPQRMQQVIQLDGYWTEY